MTSLKEEAAKIILESEIGQETGKEDRQTNPPRGYRRP